MNISAITRPHTCHHPLAPRTTARRSWLPGESIFLSFFSATSRSGGQLPLCRGPASVPHASAEGADSQQSNVKKSRAQPAFVGRNLLEFLKNQKRGWPSDATNRLIVSTLIQLLDRIPPTAAPLRMGIRRRDSDAAPPDSRTARPNRRSRPRGLSRARNAGRRRGPAS